MTVAPQGGCKVASGGGLGVAKPPPKDLFLLVFGGFAAKNQPKARSGAQPQRRCISPGLHRPWGVTPDLAFGRFLLGMVQNSFTAIPQKTFMRGAHTAALNMVADARLSAIGYRLSAIFTSDVHARGAHRRAEHGR